MSLRARIWIGGLVGILLGCVVIGYLASGLMSVAQTVTGDRFAWPQIAFMSAYPDDIRNGYIMFVAAVLLYVLATSGVFAAVIGASPGKAMFGVTYTAEDRRTLRVLARAGLILMFMAFILLAGPLLGFIFGPAADPFSLAALAIGLLAAGWALCFAGADGLSWVNRKAGVRPVLRRAD